VATVNVAVEGLADATAAERLLQTAGHEPGQVVVKRGKTELDPLILRLARAARHLPWLVLRDADRDSGDCPAQLRQHLLPHGQPDGLCLRLPVRSLEAWLLADTEAFGAHFRVRPALLPGAPDEHENVKRALVQACRRSVSRAVRDAMCGPNDKPGPGYTGGLQSFLADAWDPARAAGQSPSLQRALADLGSRFGKAA
jgi:hypothetical protein